MGIVRKQAVYNSVISYIGIALGYVNTVLLFPHIFSAEQFGLTRVLSAISTILVTFSGFGINKIAMRFFPFFKTDDKKNNGFFSLMLGIPFVGFAIMTTLYLLFDDWVIDQYKEKSSLFVDNYLYVIPLTFLTLYGAVLESYLQATYRTILSNIVRDVLIRVLWLIDILLFYWGYVDFDQFLMIYVYAYLFNIALMLFRLKQRGYVSFKINKKYFSKRVLKLIIRYGFFSILSGISQILVSRIDLIMIGAFLGLDFAGIYAVGVYVASVVYVPSKSIMRISFPIVANDIKSKAYDKVAKLYRQTSLNSLLLSGIVLIGIWVSVDELFTFLPKEYAAGKYVVLMIALAKLVDVASGINGTIIIASKYFQFDTVCALLLGVFTVATNYIFIPKMGMEGAALATLLSLFLYNAVKVWFVYDKLKIQPFTKESIYAMALLLGCLILGKLIPNTNSVLMNIAIKSSVVSLAFVGAIYFFGISEDLQKMVKKYIP